MKPFIIIFISLFFISCSTVKPTKQVSTSQDTVAKQTKKIDDAYDDLLIKANDGDSRAQYLIGCFYYYGRRVETNHSIASNWFTKSAEQNLVDAQTILGYQYMYGDGIAADDPNFPDA